MAMLASARARFLVGTKSIYTELFDAGFLNRSGVTILLNSAEEAEDDGEFTNATTAHALYTRRNRFNLSSFLLGAPAYPSEQTFAYPCLPYAADLPLRDWFDHLAEYCKEPWHVRFLRWLWVPRFLERVRRFVVDWLSYQHLTIAVNVAGG